MLIRMPEFMSSASQKRIPFRRIHGPCTTFLYPFVTRALTYRFRYRNIIFSSIEGYAISRSMSSVFPCVSSSPRVLRIMDIGARIRSTRLSKTLTLEELSEKTGLSKSFLSNVENHRTSPSINSLEKIAQSLEIPISVLFLQRNFIPRIVNAEQRDRTHFGQDNRVVEWISNIPFSKMEVLILEIPVRREPVHRRRRRS